ncbi:MAG: response regulator [Gemmatimonadales bacterium]|nr:response regulator [Gemmatimonadales bacterium]
MEPLKTLIVDDEPLARDTLRRLLAQDPEIAVLGECGGGAEAASRIREHAPDLVFLDVQMPDVDGFEALRRARPTQVSAVVFTTAYDQYALRAFEAEALGGGWSPPSASPHRPWGKVSEAAGGLTGSH